MCLTRGHGLGFAQVDISQWPSEEENQVLLSSHAEFLLCHYKGTIENQFVLGTSCTGGFHILPIGCSGQSRDNEMEPKVLGNLPKATHHCQNGKKARLYVLLVLFHSV